MKKITFIIILILFINSSPGFAQDRTPIYVHGLRENASAWQQWQNLFNQERQMARGTNNTYTSTDGVENFAGRVPIPANNRTIIFGHSTGGVVARHIERTQTNAFGGIITAGAPMDGARISNNLTSGAAANYIVNGVDKVLKGPIREFGVTQGTVFEVAGHFFKSLADDYVNRVLNDMQGGATANDLAEGSAYMNNGWRTEISLMPKIHIYGNENGPVLWRIASTSSGWADTELVDATRTAYDVCRAAKAARIGLAITQPWNAIKNNWIADGWNTSANWLHDESERGWNDLIGASTPATVIRTAQVFDATGFGNCMTATSGNYWLCMQQNTTYVSYAVYSPVNGLSDGFIKAPSATGFNSVWSNNATRIEALGVNHLEMGEHVEMRRIYNNIFDGAAGASNFFLTPIRN